MTEHVQDLDLVELIATVSSPALQIDWRADRVVDSSCTRQVIADNTFVRGTVERGTFTRDGVAGGTYTAVTVEVGTFTAEDN